MIIVGPSGTGALSKKEVIDLIEKLIQETKDMTQEEFDLRDQATDYSVNVDHPCDGCSSNPKNGGTGVCFCILGSNVSY